MLDWIFRVVSNATISSVFSSAKENTSALLNAEVRLGSFVERVPVRCVGPSGDRGASYVERAHRTLF